MGAGAVAKRNIAGSRNATSGASGSGRAGYDRRVKLLVALVVLCAACGNAPRGGDDDPVLGDGAQGDVADGSLAIGVFDPSITHVDVEIDYETGKAPYTGPIVTFGDTFDVTLHNVDRLFAGKKVLSIPTRTADMEDVGVIADEQLEVADLLALAAAHRATRDTPTRKTYYVLFVSGHFTDQNGPQQGVLGVSLGDGVIAMFKDVIAGTGVGGGPTVRHVEQTTLVHELAHAFGLVDSGVPMAAPHRDTAHGSHCDDDRCVMYYLNEGASEIGAFVSQAVLSNQSILFDAACLADVDALTGGP